MKILITGAAGFLGSNLARYVRENSPAVEVEGWDNFSSGFMDNVPNKVPVRRIALGLEEVELEPLLRDVDVVFHFAAFSCGMLSSLFRCYEASSNQIGTYQLLNACTNVGTVKRVVFASSTGMYGLRGDPPYEENGPTFPMSPIEVGKLAIEQNLVHSHINFQLNYTILRFGSVYGPRQNCYSPYQNVIARWLYETMQGQPKQVYDPIRTRAFVYVDDVLPAIWRAGIDPVAAQEVYNLDGLTPISYRELASLCNHVCGGKYEVTTGPAEPTSLWASSKKAKEALGYDPTTDIETGVKRTWQWMKTIKDDPTRKIGYPCDPEVDIAPNWAKSIV